MRYWLGTWGQKGRQLQHLEGVVTCQRHLCFLCEIALPLRECSLCPLQGKSEISMCNLNLRTRQYGHGKMLWPIYCRGCLDVSSQSQDPCSGPVPATHSLGDLQVSLPSLNFLILKMNSIILAASVGLWQFCIYGCLYQCLAHTKIEHYQHIFKKYETSLTSILAEGGHCAVNPLVPRLVPQAVLVDNSPWCVRKNGLLESRAFRAWKVIE